MGTDKSLKVVIKVKGPKATDTDSATVTVHVTDANDNAPVVCPGRPDVTSQALRPMGGETRSVKCPAGCLTNHDVTVREDAPEGTLVAEFIGCDEDSDINGQFT